eukprot:g19349.t1
MLQGSKRSGWHSPREPKPCNYHPRMSVNHAFQQAERKLNSEFRTLVLQIAAAYYDELTMVVLRCLLALDQKNPGRTREQDLSKELAPLDQKQISFVLGRWRKDGLLQCEMKADPVADGQKKKRDYKGSTRHMSNCWFFQHEHLIKVVKYRHLRMLEGLSKDVDHGSQDLVCPNTGANVSPGSAGCPDPGPHSIHDVLLWKRDKSDPVFRCNYCFVTQPDGTRKGLELELSAASMDELSGQRSKLKVKFNAQLKGVTQQMEVVDRCISEADALRQEGPNLIARPTSASSSVSSDLSALPPPSRLAPAAKSPSAPESLISDYSAVNRVREIEGPSKKRAKLAPTETAAPWLSVLKPPQSSLQNPPTPSEEERSRQAIKKEREEAERNAEKEAEVQNLQAKLMEEYRRKEAARLAREKQQIKQELVSPEVSDSNKSGALVQASLSSESVVIPHELSSANDTPGAEEEPTMLVGGKEMSFYDINEEHFEMFTDEEFQVYKAIEARLAQGND